MKVNVRSKDPLRPASQELRGPPHDALDIAEHDVKLPGGGGQQELGGDRQLLLGARFVHVVCFFFFFLKTNNKKKLIG
jgi:hypothetical protein